MIDVGSASFTIVYEKCCEVLKSIWVSVALHQLQLRDSVFIVVIRTVKLLDFT